MVRAYQDLEREGAICTRRGTGTYVSEKGAFIPSNERLNKVRELLERAVVHGRQLGIDTANLRRLFEQALKNLPPRA